MINILDKTQCCGCEACVQVCPRHCILFEEDEYGFCYPHTNMETCINCGLCEKSCPVINTGTEVFPMRKVASKNRNEEQRIKSSSGGVFILLAESVIRRGGIVFGAAFDSEWSVRHLSADTIEGVMPFLGSKYVQSKIGDSYKVTKIHLDNGREVLFSGTSCQIAGLKHYLTKDYNNLLTIEVMCHGVPSPRVWREYLDNIQQPKGAVNGGNMVFSSLNECPSIEAISFRDKKDGWGNYGFVVRYSSDELEAENNSLLPVKSNVKIVETREPHNENPYMQAFLSNAILRPICFSCPFKSGRSGADISLGDFWTVDQYLPGVNDDKGISLVYLLSEKGVNAYSVLNVADYELDKYVEYNTAFTSSTKIKYPIDKFWTHYNKDGLKCMNKVNDSLKLSLFKSLQKSLSIRFKRYINIIKK